MWCCSADLQLVCSCRRFISGHTRGTDRTAVTAAGNRLQRVMHWRVIGAYTPVRNRTSAQCVDVRKRSKHPATCRSIYAPIQVKPVNDRLTISHKHATQLCTDSCDKVCYILLCRLDNSYCRHDCHHSVVSLRLFFNAQG